jgi:hypothetical protein
MTLLGESATLLSVEVHIVTPHVKGGTEAVRVLTRQVKVKADLMVLKSNQRKVQAGVPVEEEEQRKEDLTVRSSTSSGSGINSTVGVTRHLTILNLGRLGEEELRVQTPPALVVLVDALTSDGELNVSNSTLGEPARILGSSGVGRRLNNTRHCVTNIRLKLDKHLSDEVSVSGDCNRHTAVGAGRAVHGLLDALHGKVSVALVHSLKEGNLGVTSKIHVLCAIGN